jgi:hypothetical protein
MNPNDNDEMYYLNGPDEFVPNESTSSQEAMTNEEVQTALQKVSPGLLQFIGDMFDNLHRVSEMGKPFMWQVGLVNTGDGSKLGDFVNVWAGIGEGNPIKRIEELLRQRQLLRDFIIDLSATHTLTEEEKANMTIIMLATS